MSFLVSLKVVRLLLAVSVAVWLAGGCIFGCTNSAMASEARADESTQAAVEGESCHVAQAHHCCSKAKPAKKTKIDPKLTESLLTLNSVPRGMMSDCPLAVNATAVPAKKNSNAPELAQATKAELPIPTESIVLPQKHVVAPPLSNRGPTYLRCCVFLI